MEKIALVVIDGENDFCDPKGSLFVQGADTEALRVRDMMLRLIDKNSPIGHKICQVHVTLDTHHKNDIAHPKFWRGKSGENPPPFTIISLADVKNHVWTPAVAGFSHQRAVEYVEKLESKGRNALCIWPEHCLIGTEGSCVYPPLQEAYNSWTDATHGWISYWNKGEHPFTEHYSAIVADAPDAAVRSTTMNFDLLNALDRMDRIVWCGWAGSHCLRWTMKDAVDNFGQNDNPFVKKSIILTDCCAPVVSPDAGLTKMFADWRQEFIDEMAQRGATLTTSTDFLK
jgi:nicotinamidase/pyrazinamidase